MSCLWLVLIKVMWLGKVRSNLIGGEPNMMDEAKCMAIQWCSGLEIASGRVLVHSKLWCFSQRSGGVIWNTHTYFYKFEIHLTFLILHNYSCNQLQIINIVSRHLCVFSKTNGWQYGYFHTCVIECIYKDHNLSLMASVEDAYKIHVVKLSHQQSWKVSS